MTLLAFISTTK